MNVIDRVLNYYGFSRNNFIIDQYGNGLINNTYFVHTVDEKYILQKVNDKVFKDPSLIASNIEKIEDFIETSQQSYFFAAPVKTPDEQTMIFIEGEGYFRIFPFVKNSHTIDVVQKPEQAFEAAKAFGKFTKVLSGVDIQSINITLPYFHDLNLRYQQFEDALEKGNSNRILECQSLINKLYRLNGIVEEYNNIIANPHFKLRVTHHDTKISNILFDDDDKGICVIDLDTVMPGYFISDIGDMMRTYLCPVSEEEEDFNKIEVRDEFYEAIVSGYNVYMRDELTEVEKQYFFYSGKFMIYMQALRFLTDYINNDVYYGAKYPTHNYVRAKNQTTLLDKLIEKESVLSKIN